MTARELNADVGTTAAMIGTRLVAPADEGVVSNDGAMV